MRKILTKVMMEMILILQIPQMKTLHRGNSVLTTLHGLRVTGRLIIPFSIALVCMCVCVCVTLRAFLFVFVSASVKGILVMEFLERMVNCPFSSLSNIVLGKWFYFFVWM